MRCLLCKSSKYYLKLDIFHVCVCEFLFLFDVMFVGWCLIGCSSSLSSVFHFYRDTWFLLVWCQNITDMIWISTKIGFISVFQRRNAILFDKDKSAVWRFYVLRNMFFQREKNTFICWIALLWCVQLYMDNEFYHNSDLLSTLEF